MNERRKARGRALRLTKLPFRKAIKINDALEKAFGVEHVGKVFVAIAAQTKQTDATEKLNNEQ
jgi:hypothetical protein